MDSHDAGSRGTTSAVPAVIPDLRWLPLPRGHALSVGLGVLLGIISADTG